MTNALTISEINNYPPGTYNQLFPATMTEISPLHKIMVNVVSIDTNPDNKEVYQQKGGTDLSLTKTSCLKLMTAANVVMEESKPILPQGCQRCIEIAQRTRLAPQCNGCPTKLDKAYQVSILVPEPSGGHRRYVATKELAKADYKGPVEHMAAQCETKALLRALRAGLGIKGAYAPSDLQKPFAVALVVLNTQDPELKKALIQRYAASQDALFGGGGTALPSGGHLALGSGGVSGEVVVIGPDPEDEPKSDQSGTTDGRTRCCVECGLIIEPVGEWTVEMIAEGLIKKFGRVICSTCQAKMAGQIGTMGGGQA